MMWSTTSLERIKMSRTASLLLLVSAVAAPAGGQTWPDPNAHDVLPYETSGMTHGPCVGRPPRPVFESGSGPKCRANLMFCMTRNYRSKRAAPRSAGGPKRWPTIPAWCNWAACSPGLVTITRSVSASIWPICGWTTTTRWPSFRTLPDGSACRDPLNNPRGLFNFAFSLGCCASQDPLRSGGQYTSPPTFDTLLQQSGDEIAFHIMNGDTIYEELRDGTREGIRANYRLYWQRGRSWSRLLRNVPTLFTYDDHEIGWDIHGCGEVGLGAGKWLIRDLGTSVWNEYCGWSSYPETHRGKERFGKAQFAAGSPRLHDPQADFSTLDLTTVSTLHIDPYTPAMEGEQLIHRPVKQFHKNAGVYADCRNCRRTDAWNWIAR